ncbi:MAG: hypothetical protein JNK11_01040 [Alphaproteobacteria bacterium]|nr:hypothetical protein [Alphaproteobacteria bacterium]
MNPKILDNSMQLPTWLIDSRSMASVYHLVLVGVAMLALLAIFSGAAAMTGAVADGGEAARIAVIYVLMFVVAFGTVLLLSAPTKITDKPTQEESPHVKWRRERLARARRPLRALAKD